jgi:hypothetical protein
MRRPRWMRWEFLPFWLFYTPVYLYLIVQGFIQRRFTWFLAANPGLPFGGFVEYSKADMFKTLPQEYLPATRRFSGAPSAEEVRGAMAELGLKYPVILKPDIGERGYGVAKIKSEQELEQYLDVWRNSEGRDLLLQEFVSHIGEYGVMAIRFPGDEGIRVTSLVIKEPLTVRGDGRATLEELIDADERCWLHRRMLRDTHSEDLKEVIPADRLLILADIGNHVRGATFRNGNCHISDELASRFAPLVDAIPGFNLGRFDVKAESIHTLAKGDFKIMEVNGVNSEPAHIYDPDMNIFISWADLLAHWQYILKVARGNIASGARPESFGELYRAVRDHYRRRS